MTTWLVIPARGGSKGLPGKNLRTVGGASLVAKAVHVARMCVARMELAPYRIIVDTDECSVIDAIEYFEYNILGNASGDNAPLYVRLLPSKLSSLIT